MKWSIYNELIRDKGKLYLFNSLRGKYFALNPNLNELMKEPTYQAMPDLSFATYMYGMFSTKKRIIQWELPQTHNAQ